ncbi:MAG: MGMT family protein [Bryobacteraceae bacterium]|nr:MGMT family protein [Bryobacteraceae bacterium]
MKLEEFRAIVRCIERGQVMTYAQVAAAAGYPTGARQVVWSLKACPPDVPWHRVVGKGLEVRLSGLPGLEQITRLELEGWRVRGRKLVRLEEESQSQLKAPRTTRRKNAAKTW